MRYCDKCKAYIGGSAQCCPLCQASLSGAADSAGEVFPRIPTNRRRYTMVIRSMAFASAVVVVVSVALNILLTPSVFWSAFVTAGVGCMWVSLASAIRRRHNIPKSILWQVVILSLTGVLWDLLTGWRGWSINYAVPAICVFAMASVSGFAVFTHLAIEEYMIYLILDGLLGLVPLLFLLLGWLRVLYPAVICIAVSVLSFSALCAFAWDPLRTEIRKRLHL